MALGDNMIRVSYYRVGKNLQGNYIVIIARIMISGPPFCTLNICLLYAPTSSLAKWVIAIICNFIAKEFHFS